VVVCLCQSLMEHFGTGQRLLTTSGRLFEKHVNVLLDTERGRGSHQHSVSARFWPGNLQGRLARWTPCLGVRDPDNLNMLDLKFAVENRY